MMANIPFLWLFGDKTRFPFCGTVGKKLLWERGDARGAKLSELLSGSETTKRMKLIIITVSRNRNNEFQWSVTSWPSYCFSTKNVGNVCDKISPS